MRDGWRNDSEPRARRRYTLPRDDPNIDPNDRPNYDILDREQAELAAKSRDLEAESEVGVRSRESESKSGMGVGESTVDC